MGPVAQKGVENVDGEVVVAGLAQIDDLPFGLSGFRSGGLAGRLGVHREHQLYAAETVKEPV